MMVRKGQSLASETDRFLSEANDATMLPLPKGRSVLECAPDALQRIAKEASATSESWNAVEIYTPVNLLGSDGETAKTLKAFERGVSYQPRFRYAYRDGGEAERAGKRLKELLSDLRAAEVRTPLERALQDAIRAKIEDDIAVCGLMIGIGRGNERMIKAALNAMYPALEPRDMREEKWQLKLAQLSPEVRPNQEEGDLSAAQKKLFRETHLSAEAWRYAFEKALDMYGLLRRGAKGKGFAVVVQEGITSLDVRHRSVSGPTVFLPTKGGSAMELVQLLRHEIDGHARQAANGDALFGIGGGKMAVSDETFYEGLAMRLEGECMGRHFGSESASDVRLYAHAVRWAEQGKPFMRIMRDLYERYVRFLPLDEETAKMRSWRTAYRVMRGHLDCTNSHAFAMRKDLAYISGAFLDRTLCASGMGRVNEAAMVTRKMLPLMGLFDIRPHDLPYPDMHTAEHILKALIGAEDVSIVRIDVLTDRTVPQGR